MGKVRRKSEVISSLRAEYPTTGSAGGPSLLGGLESGWGRCSVSTDALSLVANPETEGSPWKEGFAGEGKGQTEWCIIRAHKVEAPIAECNWGEREVGL